MTNPLKISCFLAIAFCSAPVFAQSSSDTAKVSVGIGAFYQNSIYGNQPKQSKWGFRPELSYAKGRFIADLFQGLSYDFYTTDTFKVGAHVRYSLDDRRLAETGVPGAQNKQGAFWTGLTMKLENPIADISGQAEISTRGKHLNFTVSKSFEQGAITVTPFAGVNFYDKKYVGYYYGTADNHTGSGYKGQRTTNLNAGLKLEYALSKHHSIYTELGVNRLGKGIQYSPLVKRKTSTWIATGYSYHF